MAVISVAVLRGDGAPASGVSRPAEHVSSQLHIQRTAQSRCDSACYTREDRVVAQIPMLFLVYVPCRKLSQEQVGTRLFVRFMRHAILNTNFRCGLHHTHMPLPCTCRPQVPIFREWKLRRISTPISIPSTRSGVPSTGLAPSEREHVREHEENH